MAFLDEIGLLYYDTKIKEYITQKVSSSVGNAASFRFEVVTELPQTGEVGVVYLKALAELESSNLYEEFIWVDDSYEFIGTNEIDLSNYYTKEDTNKLVEDSAYTLPAASATELGGIKVGNNLTIENGVLSVAGDFTGAPGESLQYNWDGTELGVKTTSETDYTYVDLKGEPGDNGTSITITATTSSTEDGGANTITFSDGTVLTVYNGKTGSTGTASTYEAGQNISIQDGEISALGYTYDGTSTVDFGSNTVRFEQGSSIKELDRTLTVYGDSGLDLLSDGNIKIASTANLVEVASSGDITAAADNGSIYITAGTDIELDAEVIKLSTALVLSDLTVDGKVNSSGGFFLTSDINKKNVVAELDLNKSYELIDKCLTILYTLKEDPDNKVQVGLIAQEVQEIFPELISEAKDGSLSLDYSRLTVIILKVLKDLIIRIHNLENK